MRATVKHSSGSLKQGVAPPEAIESIIFSSLQLSNHTNRVRCLKILQLWEVLTNTP